MSHNRPVALRRLILILVGVTLPLHYGCGAEPKKDVAPVVALLGEAYESVFVADGGFLSESEKFGALPKGVLHMMQMPFGNLIGPLLLNEELKRQDLRAPGVVAFAAIGAKNFRSPIGLGAVVSDFCYVIRLSNKAAVDLRRHAPGQLLHTPGGLPAWTWTASTEGQKSMVLYVAQPTSRYLVLANQIDQLESIATGLVSARAPQDLLGRLPEDMRNSPIWGYRRYRLDVSQNSKQASGADLVEATAQELRFFANPTAAVAWWQYTSTSELDGTPEVLQRTGPRSVLHKIRPFVWQATVPLADNTQNQEDLFAIMSMFGFGIYL